MDFKLRRPRISDLDSYAANIVDPVIAKAFMTNPTNKKEAKKELEQTIAINNRSDTDTFFIIVHGKAVGEIGMNQIEKNHKAKLSYWLGKDFRGKGIMTKAMKQYLAYAFKKYKLKRIFAYVRTSNKISAKVLEKSGFRLEGILKKNKRKNGRFLDDFLYAKVR